MVAALLSLIIAVRFIGPHHLFPKIGRYPVVPALSALLIPALFLEWARGRVRLKLRLLHFLLLGLFVWMVVSLLVSAPKDVSTFAKSAAVLDLLFVSLLMLLIDSWSPLRALCIAMIGSIVVIGALALPQLWGPHRCGEWREGDMFHVVLDERSCVSKEDCYHGATGPRVFQGPGDRLWRCERRGPFNVAAYIGRLRWVGMFSGTNVLAAVYAYLAPLLFALAYRHRRRAVRWALPVMLLYFAGILFGTGSRGGQIAFAGGLTMLCTLLWGKRALIAALVLAALLGGSTFLARQAGIRNEAQASSTDGSTKARLTVGVVAFYLVGEYPVFGVGINNFVRFHHISTHNTYLQSLAELGLAGSIIFALLVWLQLKLPLTVRRAALRAGNQPLATWAASVAGSTTSLLLTMLFSHWLTELAWLLQITMVNALTAVASRELPELRARVTPWDMVGSTVTFLLVVGAVYLVMMIQLTIGTAARAY